MLSIGVGNYHTAVAVDPSFGTLDFAVSDASYFASVLGANIDVSYQKLLTSDMIDDGVPTRVNILRGVEELHRSANKNTIIYFSGHGTAVNGSLHLCPDDYDPRVPEHSSVAVSTLVNILARNRGWALIVIDACRNQVSALDRYAKRNMDRSGVVFVADNVCILLACSNDQQAIEMPTINGEAGGGVFTHFLCKEIQSRPRTSRNISVGDFFGAAQLATSSFVSQTLGLDQTPRSVGMSGEDVCLRYSADRRRQLPVVVHPLAAMALGAGDEFPPVDATFEREFR